MREEALAFAGESEPKPFRVGLTTIGLLVPATWLLAFWSLVLHARLATGEWPHGRSGNYFEGTMRPETIDPNALGLHSDIVLLSAIALWWVVPVVLLLLCVGLFDKRLRQPPWMIVVFLGSSALAVATLFLDPGGFVDWLVD